MFHTHAGVPAAIIRGRNARTPWKTPSTLMSMMRFQFATGVSHRYPNCSMPALFTSSRTGPTSR